MDPFESGDGCADLRWTPSEDVTEQPEENDEDDNRSDTTTTETAGTPAGEAPAGNVRHVSSGIGFMNDTA
jgi:hypothetical protein